MARRRTYDDDDGRTIADMSGLQTPRLIVPRHWDSVRKPPAPPPEPKEEEAPTRPWEQGQDELSAEDRRVYILAAVRAAQNVCNGRHPFFLLIQTRPLP